MTRRAALAALGSAALPSALAQNRAAAFGALADRYFDEVVFRFDPVQATQAGFHQHDARLPVLSRAEIDAEITAQKKFESELEAFEPRGLPRVAAADRELMLSGIRSRLLELEQIRRWQQDPNLYSSGVANAIFVIMSRKFAPAAQRLRSAIEREKQIPDVFRSARANLENPPRIYTEIALEQLPGIVSFFQNDVPAAFREVTEPRLAAQFRRANEGAIDSLRAYEVFLRDTLLAKSQGDFRIGEENYRKKLLFDEMVDTPIDRLLEQGVHDLKLNQAAFRRTAADIDRRGTPAQILKDLESDHPPAPELLSTFRGVLDGLRRYVEEHRILTIPSQVAPIVEESPPFMRALTTASMDTPGPFETSAQEAFFNVTLPESGWRPERVREYLEGFNRGTIISTAVHEVYPGHYTQFLWIKRAPSKVRKLMGCGSNAEGWAHYAEQMMLEEGYGDGDPKLRLGQLQDALLRDARYIAGIRMHTGTMTQQQAVEFFVNEGYQVRPVAEKEAKRGTSDPTYLVYTLGKLEILKLREDYRRLKGSEFSLREFHDRFLAQGYPPLKIVREVLLGS